MSPETRYHIGDHLVGAVRDGTVCAQMPRAVRSRGAGGALQPRAKSERISRTK